MYKGPKIKLEKKAKRRRLSEYGLQLREKQRLRQIYGIREKKLKNYYKEARKVGEDMDRYLIRSLESRLDNAVYRAGFAASRPQARQLVNHGHFLVNSRKATVPSFLVSPGDEIEIKKGSRGSGVFKYLKETLKRHQPPAWLEVDEAKFKATVIGEPQVKDLPEKINLSLIIEYYSR
jgi:small subunit ribosomal protein S4